MPRCDVEGCIDPSEAFCYTANHNLCKEHHLLFHDYQGKWPKRRADLPRLKWKEKTRARDRKLDPLELARGE